MFPHAVNRRGQAEVVGTPARGTGLALVPALIEATIGVATESLLALVDGPVSKLVRRRRCPAPLVESALEYHGAEDGEDEIDAHHEEE